MGLCLDEGNLRVVMVVVPWVYSVDRLRVVHKSNSLKKE